MPQARGIPGPVEMRAPALQWAMTRRGYLAAELKAHLIELYQLTDVELAATSPDGTPVLSNNVDWVTAHFTEYGIHTGLDGREHRSPEDRYYLTRYGYVVGEGKVVWPTKHRHGPRRAPPDPRQLPAEDLSQ
jgi:hypothetical protein